MMTFDEAFDLLKRAGHSHFKSLEIATKYERGELLAVTWVHGWKAIMLERETQPQPPSGATSHVG